MSQKKLNHLFVRIPKTASTSVCHALQPIVHKTAQEWIDELGIDEWNNRYTFSVVREPYDRFISMYYFLGIFGKAHWRNGQRVKQDINEWLANNHISSLESHNDYKFIKPQTDYLCDDNDNLLVDRLVRFENINDEWLDLLDELGEDHVKLPHVLRFNLRPDTVTLNKNSLNKIYDHYKRDFDILGYNKIVKAYAVNRVQSDEDSRFDNIPKSEPQKTYKDNFKSATCLNGHAMNKENSVYYFPPNQEPRRRCRQCNEDAL